MGEFIGNFDCRWVCRDDAGITNWLMLQSFQYQDDHEGLIEVPVLTFAGDARRVGYITDFASIPQAAESIIGPPEKFARPALIHDWLYRYQLIHGQPIARERADHLLRRAVLDDGHSVAAADTLFAAVTAFGGAHWTAPVELAHITPDHTTDDFGVIL